MDFEKFAYMDALRTEGWTQDEECAAMQEEDFRMGGPTYMRSPDGFVHAVSTGRQKPVNKDEWAVEMAELRRVDEESRKKHLDTA